MDSHNAKDMFEAQSQLYRLMFNFISSMGLKAAIELGIADTIHSHGHPITLPELVSALRIHPARSSFLYRLMRLLAHSGLFVRTKVAKQGKEEDGYDLTPCSRLLLKQNVPNLISVVKVTLEPPLSQPFQGLGKWFHRDDEVKVTPFQAAFGKGFWEYGSENPEFAHLFNEAMGSDSGMINLVIKGWRDVFEGVNSLVDVGGGVGETARIISEEFPNMKCTVLDLPHVVSGLKDSDNLKFVGGDMRQSIPSADAIVFKKLDCSSQRKLSSAKMDTSQGQGEADKLFQAQSHLYKHTYNFLNSMCLKTALQLNIPDIIHSHGRPITLPDLLLALQIDPAKSGHVYRLMRLLVHSGFFVTTKVPKGEEEEEGYDLTPSSRLLLRHNLPTLSPFVQAMFHTAFVHTSECLGDWFQGNELTPFHTANGMGFWDYLSQNQEFNGLFNEAMISDSSMMNLVIKDCKSVFEGLNSLVDVGGGKGAVCRIISESLPNLQCTVLDLPHVVENLPDSGNLNFVGGDMLHSIPSADAILLKLVLHAYSDEDCVKVLKKCREAIAGKGKEGKVIIIDIVINEKNDEQELKEAKLLYDAMMMVCVSGKEREEKEWEKLFLEAGFSQYKITPIFGLRSLIEVYP